MKKYAVLTVSATLAAAMFTGCSADNDAFAQKSYTSDTENITAICIDVRDRQIEVTSSADEHIHLNYYESNKDFYDISVSNDHILTIVSETDKEWADFIGKKTDEDYRTISLQIPDNVLESLDISTTNEDITISPMTCLNDVTLSSNGGSINFEKLNAGNNISLIAKNGDISGSIIGSYDDFAISCKIKKGDCNLPDKEDGEKALNVSENNGDVDITFVK